MWTRLSDERGTTQIEYALIAVLVAIVAIVFLNVIAFDVLELFDSVEEHTGRGVDGGEAPVPRIGDEDLP